LEHQTLIKPSNRHKNKVSTNTFTIAKAAKGKTVPMPKEWEHKVNNFIQDNKFTIINNPTQHYQKAP
jgi:hypothetical protein